MATLNIVKTSANGDFKVLPKGTYSVIGDIWKDQIQVTTKGNKYISIRWKLTEPLGDGYATSVFQNLFLDGNAANYSQYFFNKIMEVKGLEKLEDTNDLHDIACDISVDVEETPGYPIKNRVEEIIPYSNQVEEKVAGKEEILASKEKSKVDEIEKIMKETPQMPSYEETTKKKTSRGKNAFQREVVNEDLTSKFIEENRQPSKNEVIEIEEDDEENSDDDFPF